MQVHWKAHTSQRVLIIWPCFTGHINSASGVAPGTPQKYHHKHTLIQPYADTCVRVHTHPDVRVCLCNMSTCNKAEHAHVKMQFLAAAVVFTVTTRCHTELHAPWFKVRSAALYGPCPTPAHSPTDPPLASNHPCSGMSHPCSVPKETLSAIDQPHTDTGQCR